MATAYDCKLAVSDPAGCFYLRAEGHRMEPYIHDGGLALVHLQDEVAGNELAVVITDDSKCTLRQGNECEGAMIVGRVIQSVYEW